MATLLLGACVTVGPDYTPPEISTPDAWTVSVATELAAGSSAKLQAWWELFEDPKLIGLIERTRRSNLELQQAMSRMRESRARLAFARGERWPSIDGSAEYSRSRQSDDGYLEQVAPENGFDAQNLYQVGIGATWELDVFGRIRRKVEAAGDQYEASIEDERDVMVSLFAETAMAYVELRSFQQRIQVIRSNIELQTQSLENATARYESGVSSKLDVIQARAGLANTQALLPTFEQGRQAALNRLAVLLGVDAGSLDAELDQPRPVPDAVLTVATGVPADVLRQRPDIRRAERNLAARTAQIGVATAALYPDFSLTGFIGTQTRNFDNLFKTDSSVVQFATPVEWSLFNGGRVRSNISIQEERATQALLAYEQSVLVALAEVEDALYDYEQDLVNRRWLREAVEAWREAVKLVTVQYDAGLTDFNNVLTTQELLRSQEDQLVISDTELAMDLIRLYRALGGGWDFESVSP
jgi:NodT family efflux transporter outer membrane factor (OMF) lipoprotein